MNNETEPQLDIVPEVSPEPTLVEGVAVNIPLSDTQKLNLTSIRLRRSNVQKQIADLQTQDAKLESFFHAELMKTAIANKIDMQKFVLSDNLDIKAMPQAPPASFGQLGRR
jgi:hypothetical protein